jgi:ubiquinone/menaquinone biosynthesis C-methylase UbiE
MKELKMDKRKEYWDTEYYDYWKKRVEEANKGGEASILVDKDAATTSDKIYDDLFSSIGIKEGKILDIGCGWGRLFPLYEARMLEISAIDISEKMVSEARKKYPKAEIVESEAELLPFKDDIFDYAVCLGVFDATMQNIALSEMLRVLKVNGTILFTGKNTIYEENDEMAILAEEGARRKGEPNNFTDLQKLITELKANGHEIERVLYFKNRGDFSKGDYSLERYDKFYEYVIVVKKITNNYILSKFYDDYSDTYRKLKGIS